MEGLLTILPQVDAHGDGLGDGLGAGSPEKFPGYCQLAAGRSPAVKQPRNEPLNRQNGAPDSHYGKALKGFPATRSSEEGLYMSRVSMFNSPLLLGFDQLERTLDRLAKNAEGYPPYNIERIGENGLRITLAVAGFTSDDLAIELVENQLMVRGKQVDEGDRIFLHRGIAARQFQRAFMLADGIEVVGARLDNGLLSIDLVRPVL